MGLQDEVELLKRIPLFSGMEDSKLKLLAFTSERLTFADGETLCEEGEIGTHAFIIVSGEAEVVVATPDGPQRVAQVTSNDFVGEIAILCDTPRTATVRAIGEVVTLAISKDLFLRLIQEFPHMAVEIMRVLASRLERTTKALAQATIQADTGRTPAAADA